MGTTIVVNLHTGFLTVGGCEDGSMKGLRDGIDLVAEKSFWWNSEFHVDFDMARRF